MFLPSDKIPSELNGLPPAAPATAAQSNDTAGFAIESRTSSRCPRRQWRRKSPASRRKPRLAISAENAKMTQVRCFVLRSGCLGLKGLNVKYLEAEEVLEMKEELRW